MNPAFIISGLLLLAGLVGVVVALPPGGKPGARKASAILLALAPVGLIVVGLFTLESPAMHLSGAMLGRPTTAAAIVVAAMFLAALHKHRTRPCPDLAHLSAPAANTLRILREYLRDGRRLVGSLSCAVEDRGHLRLSFDGDLVP
jgi:hypothetical protein